MTIATAVIRTCENLPEQLPILDTIFILLKNQWVMILTTFIFIPLLIYAMYRGNINNSRKLTKSSVKEKMFFMVLLIVLFQFIAYLIILSADFSFVTNLVNSLK